MINFNLSGSGVGRQLATPPLWPYSDTSLLQPPLLQALPVPQSSSTGGRSPAVQRYSSAAAPEPSDAATALELSIGGRRRLLEPDQARRSRRRQLRQLQPALALPRGVRGLAPLPALPLRRPDAAPAPSGPAAAAPDLAPAPATTDREDGEVPQPRTEYPFGTPVPGAGTIIGADIAMQLKARTVSCSI